MPKTKSLKGYLFKRGENFSVQFRINGKVKTFALQTTNRREAEKKAAELASVMGADTKEKVAAYVSEARKFKKASKVKIADVYELFLKSHSRPDSGKRQLKDYKARWTRFTDYLASAHPGIANLGEIDKDIAQGYADYLEKLTGKDGKGRLSSKTFNDNIAMVSLIVRNLAADVGLEDNPFDSIRRKNQEITHKKELSEADAMTLLAAFDKPELNIMNKEEMRLCFHLGMFSGLRFSDAVNLKFSQVSLADNLIRLKPTKTHRTSGVTVTVPIHPLLREMLEEVEKKRKDGQDFIMPNLAKRFEYNGSGVNKDAVKVFEVAGFKTQEESKGRMRAVNVYGFHSFRSTFCSFAARKGVPLSTLAQITGDNIQTLQKYYVRIDEKTAAQTIASLPMMPKALQQADSLLELRNRARAIVEKSDEKTLASIIQRYGEPKRLA